MRILGLSSFRHDTAAALLEDGRIIAAIEDSKLARVRTRGLPEAAMKFCLEKAGATWHDLDAIAVATRPFQGWARRSWGAARTSPFSPVAGAYYEANELGGLARDLSSLRALKHKNGTSPCKFLTFEHHFCHAASAFYLSPFERALILTMDEDGDGRSGMIAIGDGTRLRKLRDIPYPHSLAWLYSRITELLGFVPHADEHKTQWMSLGGEPEYREVFRDMLRESRGGSLRLDYSYLDHGVGDRFVLSAKFRQKAGLPENGLPENPAELTDEQRRALAASVQQACAERVGEMIDALAR